MSILTVNKIGRIYGDHKGRSILPQIFGKQNVILSFDYFSIKIEIISVTTASFSPEKMTPPLKITAS